MVKIFYTNVQNKIIALFICMSTPIFQHFSLMTAVQVQHADVLHTYIQTHIWICVLYSQHVLIVISLLFYLSYVIDTKREQKVFTCASVLNSRLDEPLGSEEPGAKTRCTMVLQLEPTMAFLHHGPLLPRPLFFLPSLE